MEEDIADSLLNTAQGLRWLEKYKESNTLILVSRLLRVRGVASLEDLEKLVEHEEHNQQITILINGETKCVRNTPLSYEDVVKLAEEKGTPSITWTVHNATGGLSSGIMHPGSFAIMPSTNLAFRVVHTGNA